MVASNFQNLTPDPSEDPLWQRIDAYDLEALDPTLSFSEQLVRDQGWTADYAARVIEEYKRFCYLSLVAGQAVFPPDSVDQVWRQHLSYSRDYWDIYCAKILEAQLHHDPVQRADTKQAERRRADYIATVTAYERLSGERPPLDIWPIAELLFANRDSMRRVNVKEKLIVRRPPRGVLWVTQICLVLSTLSLLWQGKFITAFIVGGVAVALAVFRDSTDNKWITKPWRDGDDDGTSSGGGSIRGI